MDSPPREPAPLVKAGLGPSRGDRARPELEYCTLRRRPSHGQLQQDPLTQLDAVEASNLGGDPHGEGRSGRRTRDDRLRAGRLPDTRREEAPLELVQPETAPPESCCAKRARCEDKTRLRR